MGSRRLITVLLVCLVIYNDIPNTQANVGNHQEERHEYQYQRSSKVVGGTGYYNSRSGNAEQTAENFDGWTQSQRDQVEGMAEKLRTELSTAQPYYGQGCSKICALIPGFAGRSQEEIDQIAKEMTTQIIEDLQSGKLVRSQMNQPNWFEHQVAQKIIDLRKHHEEQYQQNVYRATSRFHENQGSQVQPDMYAGGGTYNKETEDVQQQQENVFTDDDLRQIQQSVFDQRQQQQQGNFYQQQSQNQQHTVYTRPVNRYYNTQTTSRDSTNEQRFRTVYPTPMVVTNNVKEEKNFTSSSSTASVPQINVYNQYGRTDKEMEDTEYTRTQTIPVVIPTQRTTTTTNVHVTQEEKEVRRQPQLPRVYNREENTAERETIYNRNRPSIVPPPRRTSYEVHNTEEEQKIVEVHTPSPVPATNNRHSIYNHVEESEVVPNYQPRVTIDKNTEFEILDHRRDYRPQVPTTHTQTTIHERQEEKHHQHHIPVTPATPETTYWEDRNDVEVTQVVQQVTPRYQPSTSHHVITVKNEETSSHLRPRPYPVYPNHGLTFERNQTSTSTSFGRPTYPIYPSFRTNATTFENGDTYIRYESHIPTTYVIKLTAEEYEERLHHLRNVMSHLGYARLTDEEYNATIAAGGFTHNGYKFIYNGDSGRFEKITVTDLTVEEYKDRLYCLRNELNLLGYTRMTETEYNETIATGRFTYNGYNYVYNGNTGRFEKTTVVMDLTDKEYADRLYRLRNTLNQLGYNRMTETEYNETIATGSFTYNGYNYVYNGNTGRFEKTTVVMDLTEEEYEAIYKILQQKLREIGFGEMCQQEVQQAITTGVFIRDGNKFVYDSGREQYEKIRITNEERKEIFSRIQVLLRREGLRLLTQKENEGVLINGHFIRAAHQWIYNIVNGTIVKTIFVGDFAEFTDDEYREIYQKIQETLRSIGYAQMSDGQCNATITSGTFERGGIYWSYNPDNGKFERILLSQEEYRDRVQILRNALHRLGHRKLSAEEFREIIYQGYFYHGGYRYEYVRQQRRYKRIEFTAEEYRERLRQLQEQLIKIGYGIMDEALCNSTITTGKFYFNGHEWVYSFKTRDYQIGKVSSVSGRGDIPATFFGEDYGSDEMVESEPGVGYYPIGKKPEVGLSTPEPFDRIRENTEIPTTTRPEPTFIVPNEYQRDRYKHEQHLTTQMWPTQPTTVSERRYHRKQTTYTQTTGVQPQTFATQRSTRHVPGSEFGEDNELEETSTPFEPLVVSTQAYLVYDNGNGNERPRPYRPDDQSEIIERYLNNERPYSPKYYGSDNNEYQQQTDPTPENIEDLGDLDFNGQAEEDVQQQLVDLDFEAEDLRQQQVDVNSDDDRNDQQRLLDGYARESGRTEYNSHYHGQKETADEYDAQVVQVTDKADGDNKESPGLWTRFKDKTKDIFG
ncbi:uncharacterized protein LOC119070817 isoform X3 [Bradysia coprophila]|uniref:uncharacterized protein LOC119070817 isoform X3 n=1 Tax=Bradysia coprophila TaxID=38358 RepID=UPI00187D8842|nr:uncharacterized protein LOC119070817 isoform X3 [Bradysia coprophila]